MSREELKALWDYPIQAQIFLKYTAGRNKYGPEWNGFNAIPEAHSEGVDGAVYLAQAIESGLYRGSRELALTRAYAAYREGAQILMPVLQAMPVQETLTWKLPKLPLRSDHE